jgi:hypothetical protein
MISLLEGKAAMTAEEHATLATIGANAEMRVRALRDFFTAWAGGSQSLSPGEHPLHGEVGTSPRGSTRAVRGVGTPDTLLFTSTRQLRLEGAQADTVDSSTRMGYALRVVPAGPGAVSTSVACLLRDLLQPLGALADDALQPRLRRGPQDQAAEEEDREEAQLPGQAEA